MITIYDRNEYYEIISKIFQEYNPKWVHKHNSYYLRIRLQKIHIGLFIDLSYNSKDYNAFSAIKKGWTKYESNKFTDVDRFMDEIIIFKELILPKLISKN